MTSSTIVLEDRAYRHVVASSVVTLVSALLAAVPMREVGPAARRPRRLLDLRGLGKEMWQGVDPVAYVRDLRDEWDR